MKVRSLLHVVAAASAMVAVNGARAADYQYCTARELRSRETETVQLIPGVRDKPAFYLRNTWPSLVLFFKPEDVVALFEDRIAKERADKPAMQRSDFQDRLDWIRADLPLKEDTDLFKYALREDGFAVYLEYWVADLLDRGHAAVDFSPLHIAGSESSRLNDPLDPTTIKRVFWKNNGGDGRKYCDPKGLGILSVVDTISG